mmetsp:Transcript_15317/g.20208  ORF Transcript_15317/g.20208 Transcript_15317/m.20208 type:complete len:872 (-) Transcript_15317:256-2871(-)
MDHSEVKEDGHCENSAWVKCLVVVHFDVEVGHKLVYLHPPNALSELEEQKLKMLAMPDCNVGEIGSAFYCFRTRRRSALPLFSGSVQNDDFDYCYTLFHQEENAACSRGYQQKSVVVVCTHPYVTLYKRVLQLLAPLYWGCSSENEVLDLAYDYLANWPPAIPGAEMELPFFGENINFRVPTLHRMFRFDEGASEVEADSTSAEVVSAPLVHPFIEKPEATTAVNQQEQLELDSQRKLDESTQSVDVEDLNIIVPEKAAQEGIFEQITLSSLEDEEDTPRNRTRDGLGTQSFCSVGSGGSNSNASVVEGLRERLSSFTVDARESFSIASAIEDPEGAATPMASTPLSGRPSSFAELLIQSEETNSPALGPSMALFQSVGLYSLFGPLVNQLWTLWELTLTAQPLVVFAPNAAACSSMILGLVSLTSPVWYSGDFRPYFTAFDPDYNDIVLKHDQLVDEGLVESFPSMILGVTNPYFLKTLSKWPNAIVLPGIAAYGKRGSKPRRGRASRRPTLERAYPTVWSSFRPREPVIKEEEKGEDQSQSPPPNQRSESCSVQVSNEEEVAMDFGVVDHHEVHQKTVAPSSNLEDVVENDPVETKVITRGPPIMRPNKDVIKQLLTSCPRGKPFSMQHWRESVFAINDVVLRRHFRQLTESFLQPFEKYFLPSFPQPQNLSSVQASGHPGNHLDPLAGRGVLVNKTTGISFRLGLYDDPEALLPAFDMVEFIQTMQNTGPPKNFQEVLWQPLYERFITSPNFRPWYNRRRSLAVEELRAVCRAVCMSTSPEELVSSLIGYGDDHIREADLVPLLVRMRSRRDQEMTRSPIDEEFLHQINHHMEAVEAALPPILVDAVKEAYVKPKLPSDSQSKGLNQP